MSPPEGGGDAPHYGFPRVSGDEPVHVTAVVTNPWFSPRERG